VRDERIDFLRFLGLTMIILAHVDPPGILLQVRNFDVPLLVMVAGLAFRASYRDDPYASYLWARFRRLVLPVWLFLSAFFLFILLTGYPIPMPDFRTIATSYLLLSGFGDVWVLRIFLLVAIAAPFIYRYSRSQPSTPRYLATVIAVYLVYELILVFYLPLPKSVPGLVFESLVLYLVSYAVVFAIGIRLPDLSRGQLALMAAAVLLVFMSWIGIHWVTTGRIEPTQYFRYPPQLYYLSYAMFAAMVAWAFSGRVVGLLGKIHVMPVVRFAGQNSIWIYLWHIPLLAVIRLPFLERYAVVLTGAFLVTWLQAWMVRKHVLPRLQDEAMKRNVRVLLTG